MISTRASLIVLSTAVAASLTLGSGWVHGTISHRWGTPVEMGPLAKQLDSLPEKFGPWTLASQQALAPEVSKILQCSGAVDRQYVNRETGASVRVAFLLGPAGPISVHTPEICYSSRDHEQMGERTAVAVGQEGDTFWALTFRGKNPVAGPEWLRVYYGWSAGGPWSATGSPRVSFAGKPYLYKVEVSGFPLSGSDREKDDACRQFLEYFVPAARDCLVKANAE